MFIELTEVEKAYGETHALADVNLGIDAGRIITVLGPSGSGKSTLLNVIGGLDTVDAGTVTVDGCKLTGLGYDELVEYRRRYLGFVFQFYNLIPNLTLRENVETSAYLTDDPLDLDGIIAELGLTAHAGQFPAQLSGGEQQRCAIGRALAKKPKLLLCDEPTGALDYTTSREILAILEQVNRAYGTTMLIVTHNEAIARMSDSVVHLRDGRIVSVEENAARIPAAEVIW